MAKIVISLEINERLILNEGVGRLLSGTRLGYGGSVVIDGMEAGTWSREEDDG